MAGSLPEGDSRTVGPLRSWERAAAVLIGVVFAVLAVIATFVSANQAGTAAMLAVAAAFLIIGVQGTALVRFASGSASVELDRRVAAAVQRAGEVAETDPQQALGILEGAAIMEPSVGPAAGAFRAMSYESAVRRALERIRADATQVSQAQPPVNFVLQSPAGTVLVCVVYRRSRTLQMIDLAPLVATRQLEDATGGLIVTNQVVAPSAETYVATASEHGVLIGVVTWNDVEDDEALAQALHRLIDGRSPDASKRSQ